MVHIDKGSMPTAEEIGRTDRSFLATDRTPQWSRTIGSLVYHGLHVSLVYQRGYEIIIWD